MVDLIVIIEHFSPLGNTFRHNVTVQGMIVICKCDIQNATTLSVTKSKTVFRVMCAQKCCFLRIWWTRLEWRWRPQWYFILKYGCNVEMSYYYPVAKRIKVQGMVVIYKCDIPKTTTLSVTKYKTVFRVICAQDMMFFKNMANMIGVKLKVPMILDIERWIQR